MDNCNANKLNNEAQIRINRAETKFKMLFELSPIGMALVSHKDGEFIEVNKSLLNSTGYTKEEFLKLSYWDITPREYQEQEEKQIEDLNETGRFGPNEKEYIRKDGSRYPIKISGFMLIDTDGSEIVWGMIEDISERKTMEEELKFRASHDSLTSLANRRLLHERLKSSIEYCEREEKFLGVFMIDLDKFKVVNDTYGHSVGDELLIQVGKRINSVINRKTDTVARMGGDEFAVVTPIICSEENVSFLASKICEILNEDFLLSGNQINISASIGVSIFPIHGKHQDTLITKADYAAYEVKKKGGNAYQIYDIV